MLQHSVCTRIPANSSPQMRLSNLPPHLQGKGLALDLTSQVPSP